MLIKESAENYLEAILKMSNQKGYVRSVDIANDLGVTKPSVSVAMKRFREEGYITIDTDGCIRLTEKGAAIAERVYERHRLIARILMHLGVSEAVAFEDSCKIEHDLSEESFEKIKAYIEKEGLN